MTARFESVADAQRLARRRLPSSVYQALLAGSEQGISYADNTAAFAELTFARRRASATAGAAGPTLATTVLGQSIALPVLISPTGVQAVHPDGEVAVARAAAARGTALGLSSFAGRPIEDVVAANPQTFFQLCWSGSKNSMSQTLDRARSAGAVGLIITLDWSFSQGRDWGSPSIPDKIDLRTAVRFAPEVLRRPGWLWRCLSRGRLPDLTVPNLAEPGRSAPTFFEAYRAWQQTPPPSWDDVRWLGAEWGGPFLLKGICRVDDARRAVQTGASGISVSNHGGNNLDGTPAPIRALPAVVDAVGDQIEVLMDGGVRHGRDVVAALALGARAVMIGRAYLWGLAAAGQPGVETVLDLLRTGIESTLIGLGHASIHDLTRDDVLIPTGFTRSLGAD
jgi:heme/flavin dehydrogenase (mycofactocin system)